MFAGRETLLVTFSDSLQRSALPQPGSPTSRQFAQRPHGVLTPTRYPAPPISSSGHRGGLQTGVCNQQAARIGTNGPGFGNSRPRHPSHWTERGMDVSRPHVFDLGLPFAPLFTELLVTFVGVILADGEAGFLPFSQPITPSCKTW